ncbi:hypothetical protein LR989_004373 [Salmonella enterica]|nr:hypothetical protein [Salmonella enterica]
MDLKSQEDAPVTGKDVAGYADRVNTSLRDELVKVWLTLALMFTAPDVLRGFIRWGAFLTCRELVVSDGCDYESQKSPIS